MPLRRLFAASSVLFLIVLAVSPAKNALSPYRSLQKRYRTLGASRARSQKAARDYESRPVEIRQLWLRDLDNRVDRCVTCHLGVADPVMENAPAPFGLHPRVAHAPADFERFGCTSCHGGQGPATSRDEAHGIGPDVGPPMTPAAYIESGCGRCHTSEAVPDAPVLSRGRAVMSRAGCFACHSVRGQEGFRSEAPPLAGLPLKTGAVWVRRWLKDPRAVDPNASMPNFQLQDRDIEEIAHYLLGAEVPKELAARIQSAAAEPPGDSGRGKKIFAESRCISCHTVEGKGNGSASELSKVASAATPGWLLAFLREPAAFNPRTRMPRYHLSESESRDIVAYLEDELRDFEAPKDILEPLRVNKTLAEAGEKKFRQYGCFSCHTERGANRETFGPPLDGIGDKKAASLDFGRRTNLPRTLPAWLAAKLADPRSFATGLKMPAYALSPEDSRSIVTALLSLGAQPMPETYRVAPRTTPTFLPGGAVGELISRYRCLSCHRIGDQGGDVSTAVLTYEGSKVNREWLADYLVLSTTLRPILEERMPVLRMPRAEAEQLADAIETLFVDPSLPADPFTGRPASDADPAEGGRLYVTLGCRACHIAGSSGGYYGPPLTSAAKRLRPGWVYAWLKGPQQWRADVRCPDYGLSDTDALRLTAYLGTLREASGKGASR